MRACERVCGAGEAGYAGSRTNPNQVPSSCHSRANRSHTQHPPPTQTHKAHGTLFFSSALQGRCPHCSSSQVPTPSLRTP